MLFTLFNTSKKASTYKLSDDFKGQTLMTAIKLKF